MQISTERIEKAKQQGTIMFTSESSYTNDLSRILNEKNIQYYISKSIKNIWTRDYFVQLLDQLLIRNKPQTPQRLSKNIIINTPAKSFNITSPYTSIYISTNLFMDKVNPNYIKSIDFGLQGGNIFTATNQKGALYYFIGENASIYDSMAKYDKDRGYNRDQQYFYDKEERLNKYKTIFDTDNVRFLPNPTYHLDMYMAQIKEDTFLVNDFQLNPDYESKYTDEEKQIMAKTAEQAAETVKILQDCDFEAKTANLIDFGTKVPDFSEGSLFLGNITGKSSLANGFHYLIDDKNYFFTLDTHNEEHKEKFTELLKTYNIEPVFIKANGLSALQTQEQASSAQGALRCQIIILDLLIPKNLDNIESKSFIDRAIHVKAYFENNAKAQFDNKAIQKIHEIFSEIQVDDKIENYQNYKDKINNLILNNVVEYTESSKDFYQIYNYLLESQEKKQDYLKKIKEKIPSLIQTVDDVVILSNHCDLDEEMIQKFSTFTKNPKDFKKIYNTLKKNGQNLDSYFKMQQGELKNLMKATSRNKSANFKKIYDILSDEHKKAFLSTLQIEDLKNITESHADFGVVYIRLNENLKQDYYNNYNQKNLKNLHKFNSDNFRALYVSLSAKHKKDFFANVDIETLSGFSVGSEETFKDIYDGLSDHKAKQKQFLDSTIGDLLKSKPYAYINMHHLLTQHEKTLYFEKIKSKLVDITHNGDNFINIYNALPNNSEEKDQYLQDIKDKLVGITRNGDNFIKIYNALPNNSEEKDQYFNKMKDIKGKLVEITINGKDFINIYNALPNKEKHQYFEDIKSKLVDITHNGDNFINIYNALPNKEKDRYLQDIKDKLVGITRNGDNFTNIYDALPNKEKDQYLQDIKAIQGRLVEMTYNCMNFKSIYNALPNEGEKNEYFNIIKNKLVEMITDGNDFKIIYNALPNDEKKEYFNKMKGKLVEMTIDGNDFKIIYNALPNNSEEKDQYLQDIKDKLVGITRHGYEFKTIYNALPNNSEEKDQYFNKIKGKLVERTIDGNDFNNIYNALPNNSEEKDQYFNKIKGKLVEITINGKDFTNIYNALPNDEKKEYFNKMKDIKGKLVGITRHGNDFKSIYNALPNDEKKEYFNKMKDKLVERTIDGNDFQIIYNALPNEEEKKQYLQDIKAIQGRLVEMTYNCMNFKSIYNALPNEGEKNEYFNIIKNKLVEMTTDSAKFKNIYSTLLTEVEKNEYLKLVEKNQPQLMDEVNKFIQTQNKDTWVEKIAKEQLVKTNEQNEKKGVEKTAQKQERETKCCTVF